MVKREKDFEFIEVVHDGHFSPHESPYCGQLLFYFTTLTHIL
jgi:hypothetical protein